ncbi:MAG: tetratricopeptide repeat protein [Myxococcota bacterium]
MRKPIFVAFVIFGLLTFGAASVGFAQDGGEAAESSEEEFGSLTKQGATAYRNEDYENAVVFFERAYEVKPVPNLLYNIGRAHEKLGNFEEAIEYYEEFANEPDVDIKARRDAIDRADTLSKVVERREAGEEVDEEELAKQQGEAELAQTETEIERDYTLAYIFGGASVAALATGTVFAIQAGNAHDDFESAESRQQLEDARSRGETASVLADSMFGVGIALAGVGTYFALFPPETEVPPEQAKMRFAPRFGAGQAGMSLTVDF